MRKIKWVYTTFQKEGYHFYPGANKNPETACGGRMDVSHLARVHMHYFNFKVWIQVNHNNRDIEFIQLRRWIEDLYDQNPELLGGSCEMMSDKLFEFLCIKYPGVSIKIDISEEGINGAYMEYLI